jgi:hypothetical protein
MDWSFDAFISDGITERWWKKGNRPRGSRSLGVWPGRVYFIRGPFLILCVFPCHPEAKSFHCHILLLPWYSASPQDHSSRLNRPWTRTSKTMSLPSIDPLRYFGHNNENWQSTRPRDSRSPHRIKSQSIWGHLVNTTLLSRGFWEWFEREK